MTILNVYLSGNHVAELDSTRQSFTYLEHSTQTPVSRSLPLEQRRHSGVAVRSFVESLLPDSPETLAATARQLGVRNDPYELISRMGLDCAGAVQLCVQGDDALVTSAAGSLVQLTRSAIEARLAELEQYQDASWIVSGEHWSLGGAQQKIALRKVGDQWFSAEGSEPTSHIVKPGMRALAAQALNEHLTMKVARSFGLSVAETSFEAFKSQHALVVERFDRITDESGNLSRAHFEELRAAMGTRGKYEEYGGPSAADIMRFLRDESISRSEAECNVEAFAKALVFNALVAAPDAHAGNYSLRLDGDSISLAPLYDVASGLPYESANARLSMSVGGVFDPHNVGESNWKDLARQSRMPADLFLTWVNDWSAVLPRRFAEAYEEFRAGWGFDGVFDELAHRFAGALSR